MIFFLLGYFIALFKLSLEAFELIIILVGFIFLFGALFVWLVVRNGHRTISELYRTSVSKQYVENIIHSMADTLIVVELDPQSRIKTINHATTTLLGYTEEELIGKPVSVILGDHFNTHRPSRKIEPEFRLKEEAVGYQSKSGDVIPVLYSISAFHDIDDHVDGFIIVGKDIRKLKEAQDALEESEHRYREQSEELSQSNTLKDLLLDIITHDIKNPVSVVQGVSELMALEYPEDESVELLGGSTERLLQVLKNATILSRVAMHEKVEKQAMDIAALLGAVVDSFAPTFESAGLEIDNQIEPGLTIPANPVIEEVFTNFLSNAAKYAREGKRIVLSAERKDGWITLNFADFGQTIPEEEREAVFLRNIQLEKGEKRGRGLGLAIVKYIAESLGGRVGVRPNSPSGNIFFLELPQNL